jgi:hypothetical protein
MKLITEVNEDVEFVVEKRGDVREHFIHGVFMQGGVKNKNGRVYPMENLGEAIAKYNNEYVSKSRALGELNHPEGPTEKQKYSIPPWEKLSRVYWMRVLPLVFLLGVWVH